MAIIAYKKEVSPGVVKTMYMVTAEAINRYTGLRVQMKRRGIPSKPKAQLIYKELWSMCREHRPDGATITHWGVLVSRYQEHVETQVRSDKSPHGISPKVAMYKRSRLAHVESWLSMHIDLITPKFVTDQLDELYMTK